MKDKLQTPERGLKVLFAFFTLAALAAAIIVPDRADMFKGLSRICTQSVQTVKNYFDPGYGGLSGTFLNMFLVSLIALGVFHLPGAKVDGLSALAFFLTVGFCTWGMTALNIWFGFAGVVLYAIVNKKQIGTLSNAMLFSSGLSPLITEMLFNYPTRPEWNSAFTLKGILIALAVGIVVGFVLVPGLGHSPNMHMGYNLLSAAVPIGLIGFILRALLYKVFMPSVPAASDAGYAYAAGVGLKQIDWAVTNVFCFAIFIIAVLYGLWLGGGKNYMSLIRDSGFGVDYSAKYGTGTTILNFGIFGLFIMLYYNVIGAPWNGATMGVVFCMVCTFAKGSHPGNVWPLMIGYVIMSFIAKFVCSLTGVDFTMAVNSQALVIGICFCCGLTPVSGRFGWPVGILAGALHYTLVTCTPVTHGSFSLYNGGFTCGIICMCFMPVFKQIFGKMEAKRLEKQA